MEELNKGSTGRCVIALHPQKEYLYCCGSNGIVLQYETSNLSKASKVLDEPSEIHDDALNDITFSTEGDYFAVCCNDGEVSLFAHPYCNLQSLLCKFEYPAVSIDFDLSEYSFNIAIASENGKIKIVNALQYNTDFNEFIVNQDGIRSIKYIPNYYNKEVNKTFLAIANCNGYFEIWSIPKNLKNNNEFKQIYKSNTMLFPKIKGSDINQWLLFDFTKNGKLLALPGYLSIKILDMTSMEEIYSLESDGHHLSPVNCVKFNENGMQLVSGDLNGNICIWIKNKMNEKFKFFNNVSIHGTDIAICNVLWLNNNTLIISATNGSIFKYTLPENNDEINNNVTEKEEQNQNMDEDDFDIDMDNNEVTEKKVIIRKSISKDVSLSQDLLNNNDKNKKLKDKFDSDSDEEQIKIDEIKEEQKSNEEEIDMDIDLDIDMNEDNNDNNDKHDNHDIHDNNNDLDGFIIDDNDNDNDKENKSKLDKDEMDMDMDMDMNMNDNRANHILMEEHEPFQNGSTSYNETGQRYLIFNEIGSIVCRKTISENNDLNSNPNEIGLMNNTLSSNFHSYEVEFWDKSIYSRAVRFRDEKHFILGDLNETGLILASEINLNKNIPCYVHYRPFKNLYSFISISESMWTVTLQNNEYCVALGLCKDYVVIGTNNNYLRILTVNKLQTFNVILIPGNIINITASNSKNLITVIFNRYNMVYVWFINLDKNEIKYDGRVSLTKDSKLIRMFITNQETLIAIDSNNIMSCLSNQFFKNKYVWTVVSDLNDIILQNNVQQIWPIYFDSELLNLMIMELPSTNYPIPIQGIQPILKAIKINLVLLDMKNSMNSITNEEIRSFGTMEEEILKKSVLFYAFNDGNSDELKLKSLLRKEYVQLFRFACQSNKMLLALDIAKKLLDNQKALMAANKIAIHENLPLLAEEINNILKERDDGQHVRKRVTKYNNNHNKNHNNNNTHNNNHSNLGRLQRPTAKLLRNANQKRVPLNQKNMDNVKNRLIGKKRKQNPCLNDKNTSIKQPLTKKRNNNPFSVNATNKNYSNAINKSKQKKNIFMT